MADDRIAEVILDLAAKPPANNVNINDVTVNINVLYLGTATYDLPQFGSRQTQCFVDRGCQVESLQLVDTAEIVVEAGTQAPTLALTPKHIQETIDKADVIVVGGGNTLFAMDRWQTLGILPHLRQAMHRGAILTGGSAGAICWFDGGHSDSMDPDSYKGSMLERFGTASSSSSTTINDESSAAPTDAEPAKDWHYMRVPGLGFLPGLMCPHHDRVQSNGVLRAKDFDQMLLKHSGELGIGIDHWAALVVEGDSYRVVSLDGKPGSVLTSEQHGEATFSPEAKGVPGIWIKEVRNGQVHATLCPREGKLSELLKVASEIVEDEDALKQCRQANPDNGPSLFAIAWTTESRSSTI
jgi:dipeptidase E